MIIWITDKPGMVFKVATTGYNFALAFSAWHTIAVNTVLLPKELRPGLAADRPGARRLLLPLPGHHVGPEAGRRCMTEIIDEFRRLQWDTEISHTRVPYKPFTVVLVNGKRFEVDRPSALAFRDGGAGYVGPAAF